MRNHTTWAKGLENPNPHVVLMIFIGAITFYIYMYCILFLELVDPMYRVDGYGGLNCQTPCANGV